jgi:uncharacterized protein
MAGPADAEVVDVPERSRYELRAPDGEVLGFADYHPAGEGRVELPHTVVRSEHGGVGNGSALVRGALDDLRRKGVAEVVPSCWFVAGFIRRNPEYADLLGAGG